MPVKEVKRGNRVSFTPPCNAMATAAILTDCLTWGSVIVPPNHFGAKSADFPCRAFTVGHHKRVCDSSAHEKGKSHRKNLFAELSNEKICSCDNFFPYVTAKLRKK